MSLKNKYQRQAFQMNDNTRTYPNSPTPTLTGVFDRCSLGTTLSALSSRERRELAAACGSLAYALKPGLTYKMNIKTTL